MRWIIWVCSLSFLHSCSDVWRFWSKLTLWKPTMLQLVEVGLIEIVYALIGCHVRGFNRLFSASNKWVNFKAFRVGTCQDCWIFLQHVLLLKGINERLFFILCIVEELERFPFQWFFDLKLTGCPKLNMEWVLFLPLRADLTFRCRMINIKKLKTYFHFHTQKTHE